MNEAFCDCGHSSVSSTECYQISTMKVLIKWTCLWCKKETFTQATTIDKNGCEHPTFMTWKQWIEYCRKFDSRFMALIPYNAMAHKGG